MRHANIVEVVAFGLGDADHPPCLVMERMEESLYDLLGVEGIEMDAAAKLGIVGGICEVRSQKKEQLTNGQSKKGPLCGIVAASLPLVVERRSQG